MQRLAYFKVCEVRERGTLNLRQLSATRYPPSSTIYPMAASENCARWARGWIMVLVELKFSTLGVFKFDHGPRRCGPNMPFDRRCVCFPLRWRVVPLPRPPSSCCPLHARSLPPLRRRRCNPHDGDGCGCTPNCLCFFRGTSPPPGICCAANVRR